MIKTRKEVEKEFDEQFSKQKVFSVRSPIALEFKDFIHQIRVADLEEMEKWLMNEKKKYRPTAAVCNEEVIFTYSKVRYHIKKVKKEIGK